MYKEDDDEEGSNVVQASNSIIEKHHPKLLMFQDNRRPPYWGTWRKTSKTINPRRPFAKDTVSIITIFIFVQDKKKKLNSSEKV